MTGAAYYEGIITHLITTVEALDASAYRDPATVQGAGWTRARRATPAHGITTDLGFWFDLGGSVTFERSRITHDAAIVYALRYRPDHDVSDQARIAASARILSELLATYSGPHGVRAVPTGYSMSLPPAGDAWVQVELRFTLSLPRGA